MNRKMLRTLNGTTIQLLPTPQQISMGNRSDYSGRWSVVDVAYKTIRLEPEDGGYGFDLGLDNIRTFQSPHHLLLKCRVLIDRDRNRIETYPLDAGHVTAPTADEVLTRALHDNATAFPGIARELRAFLQQHQARRAWFETCERDAAGGALLPCLWPQGSRARLRIPLLCLQEAKDHVLAERRAKEHDPLADGF